MPLVGECYLHYSVLGMPLESRSAMSDITVEQDQVHERPDRDVDLGNVWKRIKLVRMVNLITSTPVGHYFYCVTYCSIHSVCAELLAIATVYLVLV
jgi:hypothetical protein